MIIGPGLRAWAAAIGAAGDASAGAGDGPPASSALAGQYLSAPRYTIHGPDFPGWRVIVPYVPGKLADATYRVVTAEAPWAEMIQMEPGDPYAYAKLMIEVWEVGLPVVIVEHDMLPPPGAIRRLMQCSYRWCAHAYECDGVECTDGLGVAKFSRSLLEQYASLARVRLQRGGHGQRYTGWQGVAAGIAAGLRTAGEPLHHHDPVAINRVAGGALAAGPDVRAGDVNWMPDRQKFLAGT